MNDHVLLRVERHSSDDLAIELALREELEVQLDTGPVAATGDSSVTQGERPMASIEFGELTTLIVTLAGAATAITSLAHTLVEFVRSRRSEDSGVGRPANVIVVNQTFIVSADADDAPEVLETCLRDRHVREIAIAPAPPNHDTQ